MPEVDQAAMGGRDGYLLAAIDGLSAVELGFQPFGLRLTADFQATTAPSVHNWVLEQWF